MFLTEDNITSKDEPWPTLNDSLDTSTELVDQTQICNAYDRETFVVNINDPGPIALLDNSQTMKTLENVYCTMVKATNDFKRILTDLKNTYDRKIEILQKERDAAVAAMRVQVHTDIDDPNIAGALHGNEVISAKKVNVFIFLIQSNFPIMNLHRTIKSLYYTELLFFSKNQVKLFGLITLFIKHLSNASSKFSKRILTVLVFI